MVRAEVTEIYEPTMLQHAQWYIYKKKIAIQSLQIQLAYVFFNNTPLIVISFYFILFDLLFILKL